MENTNLLLLVCYVFIFHRALSSEVRGNIKYRPSNMFNLIAISWGTNFILALMEQYQSDGEPFMYVAAEEDTTIRVLAPYINMNRTLQISSGLQKITLDANLRNHGNELAKKGIRVISDKKITIYVLDSWYGTRYIEGYMALPTPALSIGYIICTDHVFSYPGISSSEFVIAALEDNTSVTIIFKTNISINIGGLNYSSGDRYTLDMSSFDTLQIKDTHDLTGTMIKSDKPVAVFAGDQCGYGVGTWDCGHEVEQMVPIESLGHEYITVPLYPANVYRYRIISPYNNTVVSVHNQNFTLGSGEFVERYDSLPQYIRSSMPVMIIEYGQCNYNTCRNASTPSMITVPPISNFSSTYSFRVDTFTAANYYRLGDAHNFLLVIIDSSSVESLRLDHARLNPVSTYLVTQSKSRNFSVLAVPVSVGTHILYHPDKAVKYGVMLYGTGTEISYGFPLGFSRETETRDYVYAVCDSDAWNVSVDLTMLNKIHPSSLYSSIFLGDSSCTGNLIGTTLYFYYGITSCNTQEIDTTHSVRYTNSLMYAFYDSINPYIIRSFNWTVDLVCDLHKSVSLITDISHNNNQGEHSLLNLNNEYRLNISFFDDPNFMHELPGNPLHVKVGTDVYVKVFTETPDWQVKMRLHTCYVKPYKTSNQAFFLLKNGCEIDVNTHIISQSTHETKFVFRDFEISTNNNGLYLFCEANFCTATDYTPHCQQACIPGQPARSRRDSALLTAQVSHEVIVID